MYNIPDELQSYKEFFENTDINIPWIDWKNRGDQYDLGEHCPYCSELIIDKEEHTRKKEVFKQNYSKADAQNLKELLELIDGFKDYIKCDKYNEIISYIKNDTAEYVLEYIFDTFVNEIAIIIAHLQAIDDFGRKQIVIADMRRCF